MSDKPKMVPAIPTPAIVGSRAYEIAAVTGLVSDEGCWGRCSNTRYKIEIEADVFNGQSTADTITHELLHAMIAEAGLRYTGKWNEEMVVSMLSPVLTAFFADNPKLIKRIVDIHKSGVNDASK